MFQFLIVCPYYGLNLAKVKTIVKAKIIIMWLLIWNRLIKSTLQHYMPNLIVTSLHQHREAQLRSTFGGVMLFYLDNDILLFIFQYILLHIVLFYWPIKPAISNTIYSSYFRSNKTSKRKSLHTQKLHVKCTCKMYM